MAGEVHLKVHVLLPLPLTPVEVCVIYFPPVLATNCVCVLMFVMVPIRTPEEFCGEISKPNFEWPARIKFAVMVYVLPAMYPEGGILEVIIPGNGGITGPEWQFRQVIPPDAGSPANAPGAPFVL